MANKWITALKSFNKDKPEWTVPKKGTRDMNKLKRL